MKNEETNGSNEPKITKQKKNIDNELLNIERFIRGVKDLSNTDVLKNNEKRMILCLLKEKLHLKLDIGEK